MGLASAGLFDRNHVAMGLLQMLLTIIIMVINQKFFHQRLQKACGTVRLIWMRLSLGATAAFGYNTFALLP